MLFMYICCISGIVQFETISKINSATITIFFHHGDYIESEFYKPVSRNFASVHLNYPREKCHFNCVDLFTI